MTEERQFIDPSVFVQNAVESAKDSEAEEPLTEETSTEESEKQEVEAVLASESESESKSEEAAEEAPEKTEQKKETDGIDDNYEIDVKLEGETKKATIAQLRDSYERHAVSTKRFQEAAAMKKDAEQEREATQQRLNGVMANVKRLGEDADFMFDFFMRNAPKTFHAAAEKYVARVQADQKLYETDEDAYYALLESREQGYVAKTEQEKLAAEKAEIERKKKEMEDAAYASERNKAVRVVIENMPKAMKEHGLLPKGAPKRVLKTIEKDFRRFMHDNFDKNVGVTKEYIYSSAEKFARDPEVKELLDLYAEPSKKTEENKPKLGTVTPSKADRNKSRFIDPSDFFSGKLTSKQNPPGM